MGTTTANITPLGITGSFTAQSKTYDGNNSAAVLTRTLNGVLAGDVGNVSLSGGTATFADAQVGTGKTVTLGGASLSGPAAGNYSLSSVGTTAADITPLGITGSFTAQHKTYDGTDVAVVLTRTLNGVLAGDAANVSLTCGTATFADALAANGKTVTLVGASLSGPAAGNYSLSSVGTTTANITPLGITVTGLTADDKVYDGSNSATISSNSVALVGVLAADAGQVDLTTNGYTATFASADASSTPIAVSVDGLSLTGAKALDYSLTAPTDLTAKIAKAAVTVRSGLTANDKVYDGGVSAAISSNSVALVGVLAADAGQVDLTTNGYTATFASADASSTPIAVSVGGLSLTGAKAGDYLLTQPTGLTADITPLGITGSFTAQSKTYDGTASAVVLTRTLNEVLGGDVGNVSLSGGTATFADAQVGTGKTVTLAGASLAGTAAANYSLTSVATTTANITPASSATALVSSHNPSWQGTNVTFRAGAEGVVLSRKYSEMKLANLAGAGAGLREAGVV